MGVRREFSRERDQEGPSTLRGRCFCNVTCFVVGVSGGFIVGVLNQPFFAPNVLDSGVFM